MIKYSFVGVTSTAQNGFSQSASAQPPTGTWENGVFDYDHIKKSYIPTYKRYWDSQSKVPFLYNTSTGIWISYDDLQSIRIKNDYIKREKLAGAMFWELSSDRNSELIGATFEQLNNDLKPSLESNPPIELIIQIESTTSSSSIKFLSTKTDYLNWETYKDYKFGEQVIYENKIYRCLLPHKSLPGWTPFAVGVLWKSI